MYSESLIMTEKLNYLIFFIKNPDCPFYQDSIGIKDETIPFDLI